MRLRKPIIFTLSDKQKVRSPEINRGSRTWV